MIVIMNSVGEFAYVSESQGHTGTKQRVDWVTLNKATLFPNPISRRNYEKVFAELDAGIPIRAEETRTVKLFKGTEYKET